MVAGLPPSRAGLAGVVGLAGVGLVGLAGGARLAATVTARRWREVEDPCGPEGLRCPEGDAIEVATDDGAVLSGTVAGEGPPVVLAHCWTGTRSTWGAVARRLVEAGHQVVLYDHRGHGASTVGRDGFGIDRLGADLAAVLEAVDARDAVIGGHSMGGMAAQVLAAGHPQTVRERVRRLVLVATTAHGMGRGALDPLAVRLLGSARVERHLRGPRGVAFVRRSFGEPVCLAHLEAVRDWFVACPPPTRAGCLEALQSMDLRPRLRSVEVPATVVIGERDQLTPPRLGRALAERLPDAETVVVPAAGHMLPLEAPDTLADLLAPGISSHVSG